MIPSEKILETLDLLEYYCYADDDDGGNKYINDLDIIRKGLEEREKELERLNEDVAEWTQSWKETERYRAKTEKELERIEAENAELKEQVEKKDKVIAKFTEALEFYADPETYHAVAFFFDPPCGKFEDDFNEAHGHEFYNRPMPGKLARETLAAAYEATKEKE